MNFVTARPAGKTHQIPLFLTPAFSSLNLGSSTTPKTSRTFTTTPHNAYRLTRGRRRRQQLLQNPTVVQTDANPVRGVSALRATGPRTFSPVDAHYPTLPVPRSNLSRAEVLKKDYPTSPSHGLLGFFAPASSSSSSSSGPNSKHITILPSSLESAHGRAWTTRELTFKSFADLHKLHWKCVLEQNIILTRYGEAKRTGLAAVKEAQEARWRVVKKTMLNLRKVLVRRGEMWTMAKVEMERNGLEGEKEQDIGMFEGAGEGTRSAIIDTPVGEGAATTR